MIVNGTAANDAISVVNSGGSLMVKGLAEQVTIANAEAGDALVINGLAGNDTIDASSIKAGQVKLTLNGGDGDDIIKGSPGDDLVNGGRGNDHARSAPATTPSSGIRAMAATPSRARPAPTRCCSTAPTSTRRSTSRPMAAACGLTRDVANITMDRQRR